MNRLLPILLLLTSCALKDIVARPHLSVDHVRVTGLSLDAVDATADLVIDNPNSFGMSVQGIDFKLALAGHPFLDTKTTSGVAIKAAAKSAVPVAFQVPLARLFSTVKDAADAKEIAYRLEGGITVAGGVLGDLRLPFTTDGKLPIPRPPKVSLGDLSIVKFDLRSAKIKLALGIENPNVFALSKLGGGLKLTIEGHDVGGVDAAIDGDIAAGREGSGALTTEIKVLELLPKLRGSSLAVKLAGDLGAETPFGPLKLPVSVEKKVGVRR